MSNSNQTYLSARQAAQLLGVSKVYACRLFSEGIIPAMKVDTDWIVQRKDVQFYLDDKANVPLYYRDTSDWTRNDFYFLYRSLDKMISNRKGRYSSEIASVKIAKLSSAAVALLVALGAPKKYENLRSLSCKEPATPPVLLSDYPSFGKYPEFEKVGFIL